MFQKIQMLNLQKQISILFLRMVFLWKNSVEYSKVTFYNIKNDFYKCMSKANLLMENSL